MKKVVIGKLINAISNNDSYSQEQLEVIQYGLESIYILITKIFIIGVIAYLLGILYEFAVFLLIYNIIRTPSFGLHATKSWICLVSSSLVFLITPIIARDIAIAPIIRSLIGCYAICRIYQNSPADTEKRPIISPKRRLIYRYISTFVAITMVVISLLLTNQFLANSFVLALLVQTAMISPYVYKIFGLKYNNYLYYQESLYT